MPQSGPQMQQIFALLQHCPAERAWPDLLRDDLRAVGNGAVCVLRRQEAMRRLRSWVHRQLQPGQSNSSVYKPTPTTNWNSSRINRPELSE